MAERRTTDRRIEALREAAQPICRAWETRCNDELGPNARVLITETRRSLERQATLVAAGKSSTGKVGWHNVGLAWDFLIQDAGKLVMNGDDPRYARCGAIAAEYGCKYPIHLANGKVDHDHIEFHPGFTLAQFLAATPEEPKS